MNTNKKIWQRIVKLKNESHENKNVNIRIFIGHNRSFAQTLYVPRSYCKGKNASYYCAFENKLVVRVYNVNNVDTTTTMYYDDGTVVPYYVGLGGTIATKTEDLVRVFQEALTQEEIDILKSKDFIFANAEYCCPDKQGNTLEITF